MLTQSEGKELPVNIEIDLPGGEGGQEIQGFVFMKDILGKEVRKNLSDLLPSIVEKPKDEEKKPKGISESWVEEF